MAQRAQRSAQIGVEGMERPRHRESLRRARHTVRREKPTIPAPLNEGATSTSPRITPRFSGSAQDRVIVPTETPSRSASLLCFGIRSPGRSWPAPTSRSSVCTRAR